MNRIELSDFIFRSIDSPEDTTIPAISYWLAFNLGALNALLKKDGAVPNIFSSDIIAPNTPFTIVAEEIYPVMNAAESSIYALMFRIQYAERQATKNAGAASSQSFQEMTEGNRTVRRVNKGQLSQIYLQIRAALQQEMYQMVNDYSNSIDRFRSIQVLNPLTTDYAGPVFP